MIHCLFTLDITGSFFTVLIKSQMYLFAEPILNLEEDNRIELSPCKQWDGFQDRVRAMQPIFHYSIFYYVTNQLLYISHLAQLHYALFQT